MPSLSESHDACARSPLPTSLITLSGSNLANTTHLSREVRKEKAPLLQTSQPQRKLENFMRNIKMALNSLKDYPLRVYDIKSAQEVKGIGVSLANVSERRALPYCHWGTCPLTPEQLPQAPSSCLPMMQLVGELFAEYPPEMPTETELEQMKAVRNMLKDQAAAKRRREKEEATAAVAAATAGPAQRRRVSDTAPTTAQRGTGGVTGANAAPWHGFGGTTQPSAPPPASVPAPAPAPARPAAPEDGSGGRNARASKEYVPGIGTANFAFLIVMLQAQKGPERLQHLTKQQLMDRAEASGLADKPIYGGEGPARGRQNSRAYYDGYSSFKTLVNKNLAYRYSNPMKIVLTENGLALAERLYRDAAARGRLAPVIGIPVDGPMLFQVAEQAPGAAAAAAAEARAAAGLAASTSLAAALRPQGGGVAPPRRASGSSNGATGNAGGPEQPLRRARGRPRASDGYDVPLAARLGAQVPRPASGGSEVPSQGPVFMDLVSSDSEDEGREEEEERFVGGSGGASGGGSGGAMGSGGKNAVCDLEVAQMMEMGFSDRKARRVSSVSAAACAL